MKRSVTYSLESIQESISNLKLGSDGGDWNSLGSTVFVGLEPGGQCKGNGLDIAIGILKGDIVDEDPPLHTYNNSYNQKIHKIITVLRNPEVLAPEDMRTRFRNLSSLQGQEFFSPNSKLLKLNLFPLKIPKSSDPLSRDLCQKTGFSNKEMYYQFCRGNRFRNFKNYILKNKPRVVISFGISKISEFKAAYGLEQSVTLKQSVSKLFWYFHSEKTLYVFCYHPASRQLGSNEALFMVSKEIKNLLESYSKSVFFLALRRLLVHLFLYSSSI